MAIDVNYIYIHCKTSSYTWERERERAREWQERESRLSEQQMSKACSYCHDFLLAVWCIRLLLVTRNCPLGACWLSPHDIATIIWYNCSAISTVQSSVLVPQSKPVKPETLCAVLSLKVWAQRTVVVRSTVTYLPVWFCLGDSSPNSRLWSINKMSTN